MYNFTSPSTSSLTFTRAYENMRGEDLTIEPYLVYATFNTPICVSDVLVQRTALGRKDSNVAQIEINYINSNGSNVLTSDGKILTLQSPADNPTITEKSLRCDIQEIIFKILKTTDQKSPSFVRLEVIGCYQPSKHFSFSKNQIILLIKYFLVKTIFPSIGGTVTQPTRPFNSNNSFISNKSIFHSFSNDKNTHKSRC
jgi:hypothetical protein